MMLRAIRDFSPIQMKYNERKELENILLSRRLVDFSYSETNPFNREDEMEIIFPSPIDYKVRWWKVRHLESGKNGFIPENRVFVISKAKGNLVGIRDFDPNNMDYSERIELEKVIRGRRYLEFMEGANKLTNKGLNKSEGILCLSRNGIKMGKEVGLMKNSTDQNIHLKGKMSEELNRAEQKRQDVIDERLEDLTSTEFEETYNSKVDAHTLTFKRGDKIETIPPADICDSVEWWQAKHLNTEKIGFVLRTQVVIETENDQHSSKTTLYELPLELLDIILQYSLIHWSASNSTRVRQLDALKSWASVDSCWFRRIEKQRFKGRIRQRLKDFNIKSTRRSAIIRQNRNFLIENLDPSDELVDSMLRCTCITEEEKSQLFQRQYSNPRKNDKIVFMMSDFNQTKFSDFIRCLRRTKQNAVAKVLGNGGVVMKVEVRDAKHATSMETQRFIHQKVKDILSKTMPWSSQTGKLINQLKDEGIEILNSQLNRQTVVVWIWCHSQTALQYIQKLYESNQWRDVLCGLADVPPEIMQSKVIIIDRNKFNKTVVVCPASVSLTERINIGRHESVRGVTKLRNEIYVLHGQFSYPNPPGICVFEDRHPFRLQRKIEIKEILNPTNIGSSEKENCLFVHDVYDRDVWKITRETDDQHKIMKLKSDDEKSVIMSASNDGQLLFYCHTLFSLMIYESDAKHFRTIIELPKDINHPQHAVQTSIGNVIILHDSSKRKPEEEKEAEEVKGKKEKDGDQRSDEGENQTDEEGMKEMEKGESESRGAKSIEVEDGKNGEDVKESGSNEGSSERHWLISELNRDGQLVRRFISSTETQRLENPVKLSLESDDKVFVADRNGEKVILFDSDLKWNRTICQTNEEADEEKEEYKKSFMPETLFYDEEKKQLIVGGYFGFVNIYTFNQT